jgi:hypothetical protein
MEDNKLIAIFTITSLFIYGSVGYGAALLLHQSQPRKLAAAVALPAVLYLCCWWFDRHDTGPHGFLHFTAREIWLLPAILLLRGFVSR